MGSVASIAGGMSRNLIQRAADVCIKENRKLVLVPRETPLSSIHLENMLKLSRMGGLCVASDAGVLSLPKKCGRPTQLHCHKNLGSVWGRYKTDSAMERIGTHLKVPLIRGI